MAFPILAFAGAAYKGLSAYFQKQKADELLAQLGEAPQEQIPNEVIENQTRAKIGATSGMPAEQYKLAQQNIQRQQMSAIKKAADRRNALALIPAIQQTTNDATLKLDSANAQQKIVNQRYLDSINNQVASWKSKLFNENIRKQYNDKYNYAMSLKGASHQNANSAVDSGIAALGSINLNGNTTSPKGDGTSHTERDNGVYSYTSKGDVVAPVTATPYIAPLSNPNRYQYSSEIPTRVTGAGKTAEIVQNNPVDYGDAFGNYIKRRMMYKF